MFKEWFKETNYHFINKEQNGCFSDNMVFEIFEHHYNEYNRRTKALEILSKYIEGDYSDMTSDMVASVACYQELKQEELLK